MQKLFIANRGEIAVRILRTARQMGLQTVLGVSEADRQSLGAELADRTVLIGPAAAARSYLCAPALVHAALATGCDALHPGYGFLSEKPELARLCEQNGLRFIGPTAETIESLGDKLRGRELARSCGVHTVPGTDCIGTLEEARRAAARLGFPVVMKASAGGGGKGMFRADSEEDLERSFERASREAEAAFGDGRLYMERFVEHARHVEVQIIGDGRGGIVHFGERDCTVQRRYQKLIEEAPAVALEAPVRQRLLDSAVALTAAASYRGAGTVEFLYDIERRDIYFIEVNSRIQVEHPVSEQITGEDLIARQIGAAMGEGIGITQQQVRIGGHAIECRINAEDPRNGFAPSPGRITRFEPPQGEGLRLDTHARAGYLVPPFYDSMIGKLIACGRDRDQAIERMLHALDSFRIEGIRTTLPLAAFIVGHADFRANRITTRWLEERCLPAFAASPAGEVARRQAL